MHSSLLCVVLPYRIYANIYFSSAKFAAVKQSIEQYTKKCNDLNDHIELLKASQLEVKSDDYGSSQLRDNSALKMRRPKWQEISNNKHTYNCSASILKNANNSPIKYLCKYFNIKANEESLAEFEKLLNNFSAAEQGKVLLISERDQIVSGMSARIPPLSCTILRTE